MPDRPIRKSTLTQLVKVESMGERPHPGRSLALHENYESNGVPTFNTDRAATLGSLDRFEQLVKNFKATVVIQHDQRDVSKLPAFPASAK